MLTNCCHPWTFFSEPAGAHSGVHLSSELPLFIFLYILKASIGSDIGPETAGARMTIAPAHHRFTLSCPQDMGKVHNHESPTHCLL